MRHTESSRRIRLLFAERVTYWMPCQLHRVGGVGGWVGSKVKGRLCVCVGGGGTDHAQISLL